MTDTWNWIEWVIACYVAIYLGERKGNFRKGDLDAMLLRVEWILPIV